jgi:hypothetical protein
MLNQIKVILPNDLSTLVENRKFKKKGGFLFANKI